MDELKPEERLGDLVRTTRQQRGWSSRQLATATGIPQPTIIRLEMGRIGRPGPEKLNRIAEALDIPTAELHALAGYVAPTDLPGLPTYLRTKYRDMPMGARDEVEQFVAWIESKYGLQPSAPKPGEDERDD